MNISEVLMYASVYSEMKPHATPGERPDHHLNHHMW
jgi:hypothetical protein